MDQKIKIKNFNNWKVKKFFIKTKNKMLKFSID